MGGYDWLGAAYARKKGGQVSPANYLNFTLIIRYDQASMRIFHGLASHNTQVFRQFVAVRGSDVTRPRIG